MKQDFTNYTLELLDGRTVDTYTGRSKDLLQWLDEQLTWDVDEVESVMTELCSRFGMDIRDYENCDDCFDAITEELEKLERKLDVKSIKLHVYGGEKAIGPLKWFEVVDEKPSGAEEVQLDGENTSDMVNWFDCYYNPESGRYYAVRKEL